MASIIDAEVIAELEALVASQDDPEGYYTVGEWEEATGTSTRTVRKKLEAAKKLDRLDVALVKRESIDGRVRSVPGYRILPA